MSEELKFLTQQLRHERDEKDREIELLDRQILRLHEDHGNALLEIERLRAALLKIANMNVDDDGYLMTRIAKEALGDE